MHHFMISMHMARCATSIDPTHQKNFTDKSCSQSMIKYQYDCKCLVILILPGDVKPLIKIQVNYRYSN